MVVKHTVGAFLQAEQELANPAASSTAVASFEEITRILRKPLVSDKDKVGTTETHQCVAVYGRVDTMMRYSLVVLDVSVIFQACCEWRGCKDAMMQ